MERICLLVDDEPIMEPCRYRYVILDRDQKFDQEVLGFLAAAGLKVKPTSVQSPWQNGLAARIPIVASIRPRRRAKNALHYAELCIWNGSLLASAEDILDARQE